MERGEIWHPHLVCEQTHADRQMPDRSRCRSSRPTRLISTDSIRNCSITSRRDAPTAMRRPISRVRSVTVTSMMFMMPMPGNDQRNRRHDDQAPPSAHSQSGSQSRESPLDSARCIWPRRGAAFSVCSFTSFVTAGHPAHCVPRCIPVRSSRYSVEILHYRDRNQNRLIRDFTLAERARLFPERADNRELQLIDLDVLPQCRSWASEHSYCELVGEHRHVLAQSNVALIEAPPAQYHDVADMRILVIYAVDASLRESFRSRRSGHCCS